MGKFRFLLMAGGCREIIYFCLTPLEFWSEDSIKLFLDQIRNPILDKDAYLFKKWA